MNTDISITVIQEEGEATVEILSAIEKAFGEFDRIVKQYTRFNPNSELSNLNRREGEWTSVSQEFFDLIRYMYELAEASDGAYDPTIIDFLETYGYGPAYDFSKLENPELDELVLQIAQTRPSWKAIKLDRNGLRVKLAPLQRVDLGGIGKGYGVDLAFSHLNKFQHVLIDAGGDVKAKGMNIENSPWNIGVWHYKDNQKIQIGSIKSSKISIACSGSWARKVKQFHHIINPATGKPTSEMITVYVAAPDALTADGWATTLFVGGEKLLNRLPTNVEAMLINAQEEVIKTTNFPDLV